MLDAFEILPFETPAEITYGDLRARLEAVGKPIGGNDMLTAAHALITRNRVDFLSLAAKQSNPGITILVRRRSRQVECGHLLALLKRWQIWVDT